MFYSILCHLQGSGVTTSSIVRGMVFKRLVEGDVNKVENAKIAVYSCPLDVTQTETKVGGRNTEVMVQGAGVSENC